MSIQAVAWALEQDIGDAAAKLVLISLANALNGKTGKCFPTIEQICKESSCSKSTVIRKLKWLESEGWIVINAEFAADKRQLANSYTIGCQNETPGVSARHGEGFTRDTLGGVNCDTPTKEPEEIPEAKPRASTSKPETDFDNLQSKLIEAAGDKIQPHGVFDLSAIIGLIGAGVDLNTDILPTIKARCAKMRSPARGWAYFTDAIRDAYSRRIAAGEGLAKPIRAITPDQELAPDVLEAEWQKRLSYARKSRSWFTAVWGPMPGKDGCRVPSHLLQPNDGQFPQGGDWLEQAPVRAA